MYKNISKKKCQVVSIECWQLKFLYAFQYVVVCKITIANVTGEVGSNKGIHARLARVNATQSAKACVQYYNRLRIIRYLASLRILKGHSREKSF
jgi:hypothetical protein